MEHRVQCPDQMPRSDVRRAPDKRHGLVKPLRAPDGERHHNMGEATPQFWTPTTPPNQLLAGGPMGRRGGGLGGGGSGRGKGGSGGCCLGGGGGGGGWIGLDWSFALFRRAIPGSQVTQPTRLVTDMRTSPTRPGTHQSQCPTTTSITATGALNRCPTHTPCARRLPQGPKPVPHSHYNNHCRQQGPKSVPHTRTTCTSTSIGAQNWCPTHTRRIPTLFSP